MLKACLMSFGRWWFRGTMRVLSLALESADRPALRSTHCPRDEDVTADTLVGVVSDYNGG